MVKKNVEVRVGKNKPNFEDAKKIMDLDTTELLRVRKAAEQWRNGLVALSSFFTAVLILKGRESIVDLPTNIQILIGIFLFLALFAAITGGYLGMIAAFGMPRRFKIEEIRRLGKWEAQESEKAIRNIRITQYLAVISILFIVLAIGFTWYTPVAAPASVNVTMEDGRKLCGELIQADQNGLIIDAKETFATEKLADLKELKIVKSCE